MSVHPHAHAAVFAHTHDLHTDTDHQPHDDDEHHGSGERTARTAMLATPGRVCEFEAERATLALLYRALCGHEAQLIAYDERGRAPDTVDTLYLPSRAPLDEHHGLTASQWYRVAVAHRAMHVLLGTFELNLDAVEPMFERRRPSGRDDGSTPLAQFVASFGDPALAVELFLTLEDLRIDTAARRLLPGLADAYTLACHEALHDRPALTMLSARDAVAESLVQFSLGAAGVVAPAALDGALAAVIEAARALRDPRATVESTAEATVRVYEALLTVAPSARFRSGRPVGFDTLPQTGPRQTIDASGLAERGPVEFFPVPFRDVSGARHASGEPESGLPLEQAVLQPDTTDEADPEGTEDTAAADEPDTDSMPAATEAAKAPASPAATNPASGGRTTGRTAGVAKVAGPPLDGGLRAQHRGEFVYPEWDGVAERYRQRWCLVRARRAPSAGSQRGYREAQARYRDLLPELVTALERLQPAGRDIVRRRRHGDDLDLDACVDAWCDLRAGIDPADTVFTSTRARRRDVVVAFAMDLSASTAEALPPDPREPKRVRRTIDLQRDAVSLVAAALDRVGDAYGIYGFSGSGRDDVRVSVVKDVDERRSPRLPYRLDGLVPDHTTRMGPAIRHLTSRLAATDAATRILLVVSDGRPYDIDYGQEYGESATIRYALDDTGRALDEARQAGVRPYLVTVDAGGADYLAEICRPDEYHVIDDARRLPASLARLYTVARADAAPARSVSSAGASSKK